MVNRFQCGRTEGCALEIAGRRQEEDVTTAYNPMVGSDSIAQRRLLGAVGTHAQDGRAPHDVEPLPIRRLGLHRTPTEVDVPVVYLYLPEGTVSAATVSYASSADSIAVQSPVGSSTITTDGTGFVKDYSGLAERV